MPGLMVLRRQYIKHLFIGRKYSTVAALLYWWGEVVGKVIQDAFDTKDCGKTRVVREKDHDPKVRTLTCLGTLNFWTMHSTRSY